MIKCSGISQSLPINPTTLISAAAQLLKGRVAYLNKEQSMFLLLGDGLVIFSSFTKMFTKNKEAWY